MKITIHSGGQIVRTFDTSGQRPRQSGSRPGRRMTYSTPIPLTFDAAPAEPDPVEMDHLASFPVKDNQQYTLEDSERGVAVYRGNNQNREPIAIFPNGTMTEYESTADKAGFHVWRRKPRAGTSDSRPVGPGPGERPPQTIAERKEYRRKFDGRTSDDKREVGPGGRPPHTIAEFKEYVRRFYAR